MITSELAVVIDVNENKTGNFLTMTNAIKPGLNQSDWISGVRLMLAGGFLKTLQVTNDSASSMENAVHSKTCRKFMLSEEGTSRKLVLDYNKRSGAYEISINDFLVTEVATLALMVNRFNPNGMPKYHPAMAA